VRLSQVDPTSITASSTCSADTVAAAQVHRQWIESSLWINTHIHCLHAHHRNNVRLFQDAVAAHQNVGQITRGTARLLGWTWDPAMLRWPSCKLKQQAYLIAPHHVLRSWLDVGVTAQGGLHSTAQHSTLAALSKPTLEPMQRLDSGLLAEGKDKVRHHLLPTQPQRLLRHLESTREGPLTRTDVLLPEHHAFALAEEAPAGCGGSLLAKPGYSTS
jgi:hypothetical protein